MLMPRGGGAEGNSDRLMMFGDLPKRSGCDDVGGGVPNGCDDVGGGVPNGVGLNGFEMDPNGFNIDGCVIGSDKPGCD